jgi:uroporphyrinogen-III synthase
MMNPSLKGLRILNTRPKEQAHLLSKQIRAAEGIAFELPALEIQATLEDWINKLPDLKKVNQAIFISPNAVHYCFNQLKHHHIEWSASIKVIALGQGTAKALELFNIPVHTIPSHPDSEHLLATIHEPKNQIMLLFKGIGGRPLIEEQLLQKGVKLSIFNVYQRAMPSINQELIHSIWQDDLVDIILLTSEQSLHHLFQLFAPETHDWLRSKTWLIISERLAHIASSMRIKKIKISHPERVMEALFDYVNKD